MCPRNEEGEDVAEVVDDEEQVTEDQKALYIWRANEDGLLRLTKTSPCDESVGFEVRPIADGYHGAERQRRSFLSTSFQRYMKPSQPAKPRLKI